MLRALDVAKYFLSLANAEEDGELTSNLKLQKLLYYAQGFHLAICDEPLFQESVEAWTHGPVVPEVYHHYKYHGPGAIPAPTDLDFEVYDESTREFLDEVYRTYGQFSAWKLSNMTHEEPPWKNTMLGGIISCKALKEYWLSWSCRGRADLEWCAPCHGLKRR